MGKGVNKMKMVKNAVILNFLLNGQTVVCFNRRTGNSEITSTAFFKDKHEALLAISLFENEEVFRELSMK